MDNILDKALEFLGGPPTTPETREIPAAAVEEEEVLRGTRKYEVIEEGSVDPLLQANLDLEADFPNLVFRDPDTDRVLDWLGTAEAVALDIETHGSARRKEDRKKEALSFVVGTIRLVQLSDGDTTFTLDAALLSKDAVAAVLDRLHGKRLYLHNAIFDLPRLLRNYGVDLLDEDVRDTVILSRLLRAGQWEERVSDKGTSYPPKQHNIQDVLFRELGVKIEKETDHRWEKPLTEERLRYASDDVEHLIDLYGDLLSKVEKDGLLPAYHLIRSVHPVYMRQQAHGVPFDKDLYAEMRCKLKEKIAALDVRLREHAPEHPDSEAGGRWVWRNNRKPEEVEGRNGALRALALAGTPLKNLKKSTRLAYLKKYKDAQLLEALDLYLQHADLESDTRGWPELYCEDGRLYPNVQFFSQVTGRSAYSGPALQNIMKEIDLPGELKETSFRDCIRVPEGAAIVKADYSAQELRILAHATKDRDLIEAFLEQDRGGKDPHLIVGEKIAGKELRRKTPEGEAYRQSGKRANYGFSYGAGWRRYQTSIYEDNAEAISDRRAKEEKWAFEEAWPQVKEWQQHFGERAGHEPGAWYTTSFLGRRRYVGRGKEGRPNYCDRLNGPIQQGGADQLYLALGRMLDDHLPDVHVIITTHDEIVLECPREIADEAAGWLTGHMREAIRETIGDELATEDCAEVEISESWGG